MPSSDDVRNPNADMIAFKSPDFPRDVTEIVDAQFDARMTDMTRV